MSTSYVCRQTQTQILLKCISHCSNFEFEGGIVITGGSATGKTLVIREILKVQNCLNIYLSALDTPTIPIFAATLLHKLNFIRSQPETECLCEICKSKSKSKTKKSNNSTESEIDEPKIFDKKCETLSELLKALNTFKGSKNGSFIYIVIDDAEKLFELDTEIVGILLSISNWVSSKICFVLIFGGLLDQVLLTTYRHPSLHINFPPYTKEEQIEVLLSTFLLENGEKKFNQNLLLSQIDSSVAKEIAKIVCDATHFFITDIRQLTKLYYQTLQYYQSRYLISCLEQGTKKGKMIFELSGYITQNIGNLLQEGGLLSIEPDSTIQQENSKTLSCDPQNDLPIALKKLIIAGFIAGSVSPTLDIHLFAKRSLKQKKKKRKTTKPAKTVEEFSSRPFTVPRLIAIFSSVFDIQIENYSTILSEIRTLIDLGFLRCSSAEVCLDSARLFSHISPTLVQVLAQNIGFDFTNYVEI